MKLPTYKISEEADKKLESLNIHEVVFSVKKLKDGFTRSIGEKNKD